MFVLGENLRDEGKENRKVSLTKRGTTTTRVSVWVGKSIEQPSMKDTLRIKWTLDSNKVDLRDEVCHEREKREWRREGERERIDGVNEKVDTEAI